MYILQRVEDGAFVADPVKRSNGGSYTHELRRAKVFYSRAEAERDKCGNENLRDVAEVMRNG